MTLLAETTALPAGMLFAPPAVPVLRLHFAFEAPGRVSLPGYAGSTWHGALGHALQRVSPQVFALLYGDAPAGPRPYVLLPGGEPAAPAFSLTLLGEATAYGPVLELAAESLAAAGLGEARTPLRLVSVTPDWPGVRTLADLAAPWLWPSASEAWLEFDTRLRLKAHNGVMQSAPACGVLLQRLLERVSGVAVGFGAPPLPGEGVHWLLSGARRLPVLHDGLGWAEWSRQSGRSGERMAWGGLRGRLAFAAGPEPAPEGAASLAQLLPWLALGEWLHVGSKTTFGLGHFTLRARR